MGSATKEDLVGFAGGEPARCVFSAPELQLCSWDLAGDPARVGLPAAARDVKLVCELPIAGGARAEGSCVAHAAPGPGDLPAVSAAGEEPDVRLAEALHWRAEQQVAAARTVEAMSHLVGDVPERCRTGLGSQTCEWTVGADLEGYPIAALLSDVDGPVSLECEFPLDGGPRDADGCAWLDAE